MEVGRETNTLAGQEIVLLLVLQTQEEVAAEIGLGPELLVQAAPAWLYSNTLMMSPSQTPAAVSLLQLLRLFQAIKSQPLLQERATSNGPRKLIPDACGVF